MRERIKKNAGILYILLMTVVVAVVIVATNETGQIIEAIREIHPGWLAASAGCIGLYLFLRVATLRYYLNRRGCRISWRTAIGVTGAGQFYSAITPSASGGQPMQVLWLHRKGVPLSLGTACVSVKFLGFQTAFLLLGGVLGALHAGMLSDQLYGFRWLVALGYLVNAALIGLVLLTIPRWNFLDRFTGWLVQLGAKIRVVRRPEEAAEKFGEMLAEYRDALRSLLKQPVDALVVLGLSIFQVLAFMSVTYCLYRGFALEGISSIYILTLQLMLFIAAAFVPLPGAAGAQESGFCIFMRGIFPQANLVAAMVCWRLFSYYLLMVSGAIMMAVGGIGRENPEDTDDGENSSPENRKNGN